MAIRVSSDFSVQPLPRVVRIEPSGACNLRCMHCPTGTSETIKRGIMSNEVFQRIVEEIGSYRGVDVAVLYHGGEPFLNKNIFKMIEELKRLDIKFIKIVTNGMLVDDEMASKIIDSGLDSIEFSLDGLSPEENDRIRRGCSYRKVISTIKKLLTLKSRRGAAKPEVFIANTQIPSEGDILQGVTVSTPKYLLDDLADFVGDVKFKNTYMLKWPAFDCRGEYKLVEGPASKGSVPSNYCDNVLEVITIRWNGDVVPCCYDLNSDYVLGNIMERSLADIWNGRKYRDLRRSIHARQYTPLCVDCNIIRPSLFVVRNEPANAKN
jgi:radical SAM protein with 4Fe4S-binding SPASM domain